MRLLLIFFFTTISLTIFAQNQYPEISNLSFQFDEDTRILTVNYDLFDAEDEAMDITFLVSDDNGQSYLLNTQNATGAVGTGVTSGMGKSISWDANGILSISGDYKIKLIADDLFQIDIQEIVDQVDENRLLNTLQNFEGIRHRTANPTNLENIKDSIEQRFITANLQTERLDFPMGNYTGQNIIGRLEGTTQTDSTYIIDAHFDTVDDSPGADDNGSGTVGMLEAMRVLAPYRFEKNLHFIGFDLEEAGLLGSFDFVANDISENETIKGVFNMEMIGYFSDEPNTQTFPAGFEILYPEVQADLVADEFRGNFITNIGDQNSLALMAAYDNAAAQYVPDLKTVSFAAPEGWVAITPDLGRSDHAPFWFQNIPALMLTDGSNFRNPNYHTPNDLVSTLDFNFMTNVVKAVVGAVAEEAGIQHSTTATGEFQVLTKVQEQLACELVIAPVPTRDKLTLSFGSCGVKTLDLRLMDVLGNVLLEQGVDVNRNMNHELDLRGMEKGVYLLQVSDGEQSLSKKVVLN